MNRIVNILMQRDTMSQAEAEKIFLAAKGKAMSSPDDAVKIMMNDLHIEPNYILDLFE